MRELTSIKILMVGPAGSGKTAVAKRTCDNSYSRKYSPTKKVELYIKRFNIAGSHILLQLWELPGTDLTADRLRSNLGNVNCIIFLVNPEQNERNINFFSTLKLILPQVEQINDPSISKILVLTQSDTSSNAQAFGSVKNLIRERSDIALEEKSYTTSARNDTGIDDLFREIAIRLHTELMQKQRHAAGRNSGAAGYGTMPPTYHQTNNPAASSSTCTHLISQLFCPPRYKKTFSWFSFIGLATGIAITATTLGFKKAEADLNKATSIHYWLHELAGATTLASFVITIFLIGYVLNVLALKCREIKAKRSGTDHTTTRDTDHAGFLGTNLDTLCSDQPASASTHLLQQVNRTAPSGCGPVCCKKPLFTPIRTGFYLTFFVMGISAAVLATTKDISKMWSTLVNSAWSHTVAACIVTLATSAFLGTFATGIHLALVRCGITKHPITGRCGSGQNPSTSTNPHESSPA